MRKDQDAVVPKSERHRALNVIYFIDAQKTRSFHLSLAKVYVLAAVLAGILAWSGASIYYVARTVEERDVINDRLHAALATIFEYQSRYDGVYEQAYPDIQAKRELSQVLAASSAPKAPAPVADKVSSTQSAPATAPSDSAENLDKAPQDLSSYTSEDLHSQADWSTQWPVAIEDLNVHRDQDELELSFAIRNKLSPSRSEGYVWAVATLVDQKGERTYLGSPPGLKVSSQGSVDNPSKYANWYSIRYYKAKNFYFTVPTDWQGKITNFSIGMMDTSGKQSSYNISLAKGQTPTLPSEERKPEPADLEAVHGPVASKTKPNHAHSN